MHFDRTFHFPSLKLPGLGGVLGNSFLRNLAMGLVGIFIPLYVYELTGDLAMIFMFYLIVHAVVVASSVWIGALVARMGVDKSSIVAAILRAVFLGFLILGRGNLGFLWVAAVFWGVVIPFCWHPYHYTVVGVEDGDGKFGREAAEIKMVDRAAAAAGPFLGGLIIIKWSFLTLYTVALVLVALSAIPLLLDSYSKRGMRFSATKISLSLKSKKNWPLFLALLGYGMESMVYGVAWWVFIFLVVRNYEVVGAISSGVLFLTLVVCFWSGKWVDRKGPGILKWGVIVNSLNWLVRPFLRSVGLIFGSDLLYQLTAIFVWTPFDAVVYEITGKKRRLEFFVKREIWVHLGGALTSFLILVFLTLRFSWGVIFGLGILGLVLSGLVLEYKNKFEKQEV